MRRTVLSCGMGMARPETSATCNSWRASSDSTCVFPSIILSQTSRPVLFFLVRILVSVNRIVLAQGMSFPIRRHENAFQIGVVSELDSKEVKHLALVPIGAAPEWAN